MTLHWGTIRIGNHEELTVDVTGTTAGPLALHVGIGKTQAEALEDLRQQGRDHLAHKQQILLECLIVKEEFRLFGKVSDECKTGDNTNE